VNPDEKDQTTPGGAKPAGDGGAKPVAGSSSGDRLICAHDFAPSGAAVTALAASSRTRIFAVGLADGRVRLVHATSEKELALVQAAAGSPVAALAIAPRDNGLIAMSAGGGVGDSSIELSRWNIDVRHPEITLATLFNPVWYESYSRPRHLFQSSSGSQSFEPKYGLRPLIFGTLKATVYSMLFGAPLALMAAIFTSEFLHPRVRSKLKPAIELMASLPSVVLGFLAALFFAPLVARAVPEVLVSFVTLPLAFLAGAHVWQLLPQNLSLRLARWRFLFIIATLPVGIVAAWRLGPLVERWLFASDIRLWLNGQVGSGTGGWMFVLLPLCGVGTFFLGRELNTWLRPRTYHWTRAQCAALEIVKFLAGTTLVLAGAWLLALLLNTLGWDPRGSYLGTYDQRNTLIVGVVMGFAIIPLIYTIAEDALSTVPEHLRSASLGAGATQWQTATRIVVPIAMSGLFTALMIGLGRAVGETMIVLMATGNTPVMEWNVFNGLRSLSATIAAELPEAPVGSTHYRTLFFAAFCLFMLTFVVNTAAELVRLRFRRRAHEL
jgi:phosphate transport system permease protein